MFRPGSHNPHTIYWSADTGPDRFVGTAMSAEAAVAVAGLLNVATPNDEPAFLVTLPMVPRREDV